MSEEELIRFSVDIFNPVNDQHFVPCHFLSAWSRRVQKGARWEYYTFCREDADTVCDKRVRKVAKWRHLYSYPDLTLQSLQKIVYHLTIQQSFDKELATLVYQHGIFTAIYERYLRGESSVELFKITELLLNTEILCPDFKIILQTVTKMRFSESNIDAVSRLADKVHIAKCNGFEHILSIQEKLFYPLLDEARGDDLSFFNRPKDRTAFIHYLFAQLLRTRKFDEMLESVLEENMISEDNTVLFKYLRFETMYKLAESVVRSIHEYELILLKNETQLEFISGDQPLCNLISNVDANQFDLYYPISPTRALLFTTKGRYSSVYRHLRSLSVREVDELNRKIAFASSHQLFASKQNTLDVCNYHAGA